MDPAAVGLDRHGSRAVLDFGDRMVFAPARDDLLIDNGVADIVAESETYSSARTRVDEIIHRPCIESVFAVYELGV